MVQSVSISSVSPCVRNSTSPEAKPTAINKIGLRYTNRIVKTEARSALSDWLKPTAELPKALIESKEHFMGRIETSPQPSHLRLITVSNEPPGPDWPFGSIVMDIDRIAADTFEPLSSKIAEKLDSLHEDVWESFSSATTPALVESMSGTAPK